MGTGRFINSRITIGNNADPFMNAICEDEIMDGGWFDCGQVLYGDRISIHRTSSLNDEYNLWTMRAYEGINVLKDATVFAEPAEHDETESASNLLWQ